MNGMTALRQYQQVGAHSAVMDATPHRLIQMLLDGAISRLSSAKGCMGRNDLAKKGEFIGKAIEIVSGLKGCLDFKQGGEVSVNLDALYEYIGSILFKANIDNDEALVDEAISLLSEIKKGWDAIAPKP